ncbi:putative kinesin family protein [Ascobolus immersus RN42]|uniref:Kinesin-like protein n=1 Tax=Ascobolus immersus RN42 TaxID=1160509 RepID=A0A3N4ITL9_ASCIM|nr:putative kinesin family protein [Ascobolus immersus RN42]
MELERQSSAHKMKIRDVQQEHERQVRQLQDEMRSRFEELQKQQQEQIDSITREANRQIDEERAARTKEVSELKSEAEKEMAKLEAMMDGSGEEIRRLRGEVQNLQMDLNNERMTSRSLMEKLQEAASNSVKMEQNAQELRTKIDMLQSDGSSVQQSYSTLEYRYNEAMKEIQTLNQKLRAEETVRRKLHNQIQEMKGNIRVFCRVRPPLGPEECANISLPDKDAEGTQIEILGGEERTPFGNVISKNHPFAFDKVFGPAAQNADIYEEISQLVQSALDGYNVCIFAYGQTGSGKTFTMSSDDGMIPRAVRQIYQTARHLEERDWKYSMEGSFLEVYNENINDLLGNPNDMDKDKHEIRHDPKSMTTTVTGVTTVNLDNPSKVEIILNRAMKNRSVAATKANERSSRSHSVFILRLMGYNTATGERCEGTLNLVDLAGSERLAHSQSTGDRLKETQSINKSLACLGDVIAALGNGKDGNHIPYRNSKLTYLLQYSLGGNSKTLMFVNISPLQAHLAETLTSLKFATKVANTYIGTAKSKKTKAITES